jgi:hypothetical protein
LFYVLVEMNASWLHLSEDSTKKQHHAILVFKQANISIPDEQC